MKKEEDYNALRIKSDEIYNMLNLDQYTDDLESEIISKNNFFYIILKIYSSIINNTSLSFSSQEVNFILDFEIYKNIPRIIEALQKFNKK
ncbi:MAG: hypothetical protein Q4D02_00810 [Clostridia bacterium]|nr:hypothetical protein [Clostridia bacterium]